MEITETSAEGLKRTYKVVVPAVDIRAAYEDRLSELGRTVEIKGFRKGHVPPTVVRQRFGASVMGDVLERTVARSSRDLIREKGVRPALQPKIEVTKFAEDADLEYTVALEVMPEIELVDFATLELTRHRFELSAEEVELALHRMAEQEKLFEPLSEPRPARQGDALQITFEGFRGEAPIEGGKAEDLEVELGSGHLIPGFEDQLIGAQTGEHRTVHVSFPDDYPVKDLAGALARFEVEVKAVKQPLAVTLSEDFAKRRGFEGLDGLREAAKKQLEAEYAELARLRLKRQLFDRLDRGPAFELPPGLVAHELEHAWQHLLEDLKRAGKELKDLGKPEEALRAEQKAAAERRVRLGLVLGEAGRRHHIEVEREALLRAALLSAVRRFPGQERQIFDYYRKHPEALEQFRPALFEDKVVDFILGLAKVTEESIGPEAFARLGPEASEAVPDAAPERAAPEAEKARAPKSKRRKPAAKS